MGVIMGEIDYRVEQAKQEGRRELIKQLEKGCFYVDTRGYFSLKPQASRNWQEILKELED